ncbi:MAG: hypothetical protein OHK93_002733 [Ramalina farinacea]|uniref:S-adenosyl-L-methionine-dependent methyltransferase n=1 Tax=Ramalina farinacea TaxID=258253 RepID=A0AA43QTY5_9LECA|nr:hypothetical protein [Ramalina farinacea]
MAEEFAEANRKFFDDLADKYDIKPWQQDLHRKITTEIQEKATTFIEPRLAAHPPGLRLLDYACGTGMLSRALAPWITTTIGIDISPKMVDRYNALASSPTPSTKDNKTITGIVGDLLNPTPSPSLSSPDFYNFDIAGVCAGFHHFHSPALAIERLAERVKPGGVVLIVDFCLEDEEGKWIPSRADHTVTAHGFSEGTMRSVFGGAGLVEVGYSVMPGTVTLRMDGAGEGGIERKVFLGRARKP